ncbi:DUF6495 family protein [Cyclobacteriaceae bacterium]|nr:DUF6495 family protein [Cyclobacteriaceae bacterium]
MKYRRLSLEELEELKPEFINFLAVNGIAADDWESIQTSDDEKHQEMIDTFSDMVLEKVLTGVLYLEHRSESNLMLFCLTEDKMTLTGINLTKDIGVDLTDPKSVDILLSTDSVEDGVLTSFTTEKSYEKERNLEVFELINQGCLVISEEYYSNLVKSLG